MRRMAELPAFGGRLQPIRFDDGRTLWVPRLNPARLNGGARPPLPDSRPPWLGPRSWPDGVGLAALLVVLFLAVAGGAFPVVRRLTRRLESVSYTHLDVYKRQVPCCCGLSGQFCRPCCCWPWW